MIELESLHFADESSFLDWLKNHHDKSPGIWLVFYRKNTGKECIKYNEALDAALCYGWIDSIIKKLDDYKYARKFTPRTNTSNWSEFNKRRVLELIETGKMTEAGLRKIDLWLRTGKVDWTIKGKKLKKPEKTTVPQFIIDEFSANEPALSNFKKLAPSHQRRYVLWITQAKREITIGKRLKESINLLKENSKLGLK
jgi:uncharacterized protein YdeI (YjbR/CyaY-like superfamily)